jgi:hypothetical protein
VEHQEGSEEPRDSGTVIGIGEPVPEEPLVLGVPEAELAQAVGDFIQVAAQRDVAALDGIAGEDEDDVEDEDMQDAEPMGDDDMDGALEGGLQSLKYAKLF